MGKKNYLSYLIAALALFSLIIIVDLNDFKALANVSFSSFLISILLAILNYFVSGVLYYLIRKKFGVSLRLIDMFFLPIVGNLWSFIFPFQGNLLFTTFFFKKKYNMKVSESFSISIYLYLIMLSFTGIFAFIFALHNNMLYSWLSIIALIFILNPLFVILAYYILKLIGDTNIKFIDKAKLFLVSVVENTRSLWVDFRFTSLIIAINVFKLGLTILWFYWISISLGFNLSIVSVGLISLIMSVLIVIKVTPDNLGVAQLLTASIMGAVGSSPEKAALITLFASATSIALISTIGVFGNYYYFKSVNLTEMIKKHKSKS